MSQLKKIDYRKLEDKKEDVPVPEEQKQEKQKLSFFSSLASKWAFMDKKIKIEVVIFILVIIGIITMFSLYLYNKQPSYNTDEFYDEFLEDDFMSTNEEGYIEP